MRVDLVASQPHYHNHLLPIWKALPREYRGDIHPIQPAKPPASDRVALVAGWADVVPLRGKAKMVYVEHGAGQGYAGDEKSAHWPAYSTSGGERHEGVIGYICPSETVARRWRNAPAIAVGCPKLDQYLDRHTVTGPMFVRSVMFAFHWPANIAPEARSAFEHYRAHLAEAVREFESQGFTVYGHAHPKWERGIDYLLTGAGMMLIEREETAFLTANILICDNSSLMYEWAALDRPVIAMNAPWYRRDVEHGLRFWSHVPGIQLDDGDDLVNLQLDEFLANDPRLVDRRRAANFAYAWMDGSSSQRAADFIVRQLNILGSRV